MRRLSLSLLSASAAIAALGITSATAGAATAGSSTCLPASTQVFAAAGDYHPYFLLSGGAFEAGTPAWNLTGGAARVAGNNTAGGDPLTNTTSLSLPAGSSATSPTVCVNQESPSMRFYVRNTGSAGSRLGVTVRYTLPNGKPGSLLVARVSGTGTWQPGPSIMFVMNHLAMASPTGTTYAAFQFSPLDANGQWRVDDVYVDPFKRG